MAAYSAIVFERDERIAKLTLDRPEAMNAINSRLWNDLSAALDEVEQDDDLDVLIITGAGRAFSAGLDLKEIGQVGLGVLGTFPSVFDRIRCLEKPSIAAVNGYAITGGFELALNCDIIIASENARFADTHARVGLVPGAGLSQFLPRLVGLKKAKELSFTGNFLTGQEALQLGLVNKVVAPEDLMSTAVQLARDILSSDQMMVRRLKKLIDGGEGLTIEDAIRFEQHEHFLHRQSVTPAELERRRHEVVDRGRTQSGRE